MNRYKSDLLSSIRKAADARRALKNPNTKHSSRAQKAVDLTIAEFRIKQLVIKCKRARCSWREIAEAMGDPSRQSLMKKYGSLENLNDGDEERSG